MSDKCIHIVPKHKEEYPISELKIKEIINWFQERNMIEKELSDCTLSENQGYRFKPNITSIFNEDELWTYDGTLKTYGLELEYGKRRVFHPAEGMYLEITCPNCKSEISEKIGYEWISDWYKSINTDYPNCPNCDKKRHLTEYNIEPEWAFSNIGITLWNTPWNFKTEFLSEMKKLFGTEVIVVPVRI